MDTNDALDAIVAIRRVWERKRGRVTLADLGMVLRRCVRSRGNAALPPERWRCYPAVPVRHEWLFEV